MPNRKRKNGREKKKQGGSKKHTTLKENRISHWTDCRKWMLPLENLTNDGVIVEFTLVCVSMR